VHGLHYLRDAPSSRRQRSPGENDLVVLHITIELKVRQPECYSQCPEFLYQALQLISHQRFRPRIHFGGLNQGGFKAHRQASWCLMRLRAIAIEVDTPTLETKHAKGAGAAITVHEA